MLEITQQQYDRIAADAARGFVSTVARFVEEDYPEALGPRADRDAAHRLADALIRQARGFGLETQEFILRYVELRLGYFEHAPDAYRWAFDLLSDPTLTPTEKMLVLEDRILGVSRWA